MGRSVGFGLSLDIDRDMVARSTAFRRLKTDSVVLWYVAAASRLLRLRLVWGKREA